MAKQKVFHTDHEVLGQMIGDFTNAIGSDQFQHLLQKYHYHQIDPAQWYPLQPFLEFTEELQKQSSGHLNLVSIGISMAMNGIFPPALDEIPIVELLKIIPLSYPMNNRGTDIGYVQVEVITDDHIMFKIRNPYSEDMIYGTTYGIMKRFAAPRNFAFKVYFDHFLPRREQGGTDTHIHVEWWKKIRP